MFIILFYLCRRVEQAALLHPASESWTFTPAALLSRGPNVGCPRFESRGRRMHCIFLRSEIVKAKVTERLRRA